MGTGYGVALDRLHRTYQETERTRALFYGRTEPAIGTPACGLRAHGPLASNVVHGVRAAAEHDYRNGDALAPAVLCRPVPSRPRRRCLVHAR